MEQWQHGLPYARMDFIQFRSNALKQIEVRQESGEMERFLHRYCFINQLSIENRGSTAIFIKVIGKCQPETHFSLKYIVGTV
jgi:hypothetical protein